MQHAYVVFFYSSISSRKIILRNIFILSLSLNVARFLGERIIILKKIKFRLLKNLLPKENKIASCSKITNRMTNTSENECPFVYIGQDPLLWPIHSECMIFQENRKWWTFFRSKCYSFYTVNWKSSYESVIYMTCHFIWVI